MNSINVSSELCNLKKTRLGRVPIKDLNFYSNYIFNKIREKSKCLNNIINDENKNILVVGTEEFMYEPLLFAKYIEDNTKNNVFYHATTRSPIEVSENSNYILNARYRFSSCYEESRTTFLYNLGKYDNVIIITDSNPSKKFIKEISNILKELGNNIDNIELINFEY